MSRTADSTSPAAGKLRVESPLTISGAARRAHAAETVCSKQPYGYEASIRANGTKPRAAAIAESEAVTCAKFSAPSRPAPGITKFQLSPGLSALNPLSVYARRGGAHGQLYLRDGAPARPFRRVAHLRDADALRPELQRKL